MGPNGNVYAIALNNNSSYYYGYDSSILIGGTFTSVGGTSRNYIAQLISNGALDTSFYPGGGANAPVLAIATSNNNYYSSGIYVGGLFTNIGGQTRNRLAKINSSGSVDYYFNSGTGLDGAVYALALDDDMYSSSPRLYVGGNFTSVGGTYRGKIARFLVSNYGGSDSLDQNYYAWLDAPVRAIIPERPSTWNQSKILVAGDFTTVFTNSGGVVAKNRLARFSFNENYYDPYGSSPTVNLDTEFSPSPGINDSVYALAKIPDGRTLVGGKFNQVSGISTSGLAQIYSDFGNNLPGTPSSLKVSPANATQMILDWASASNSASQDIERSLDGLNGWVDVGSSDSLFIDTGLAAGTTYFYRVRATNYNGSAYSAVVSATTESSVWTGPGILDPSASPNDGANSTVKELARQADGKTIVVGSFSQLAGATRQYIARLNANWTLDTSFDPGTGPNSTIKSVAVQADGKILIAGDFSTINGVTRNHIARLSSNGSLDATFDPGVGPSSSVEAIKVQPDGKILVGGDFYTFNGVAQRYVARLNVDGTLDTNGTKLTVFWDYFRCRSFDVAKAPSPAAVWS